MKLLVMVLYVATLQRMYVLRLYAHTEVSISRWPECQGPVAEEICNALFENKRNTNSTSLEHERIKTMQSEISLVDHLLS